jgi:hypothetical protein
VSEYPESLSGMIRISYTHAAPKAARRLCDSDVALTSCIMALQDEWIEGRFVPNTSRISHPEEVSSGRIVVAQERSCSTRRSSIIGGPGRSIGLAAE